jgi:hypothetical protein
MAHLHYRNDAKHKNQGNDQRKEQRCTWGYVEISKAHTGS